MSNAVLTRLAEERQAAVDFVDTTLSQVEAESRDLSDTEKRSLDAQRERIAQLDAQIAPLAQFEELRASSVKIDAATAPRVQVRDRQPAPAEVGTLGSLFTASDEFRGYAGGTSGRFSVPIPGSEVRAALVTGSAPGSAFLPKPDRYTAPGAALSTPLLDALTRVPVTTGSVDVVTYGQAATGADVVAEGSEKPEATLTATVTPTPLETIAAWVEVSRQLMQDAPAARSLIDSQLTRGILRKLEEEVVAVVQAAKTAIPDATGAAGAPLIEVVRQGIAVVENAGFSPSVILGSPASIASLDIAVFGSTLLGPSVGSGFWGLRPVAVPGLGPSEVFVADGAAAMVLFERTGVEVFMTDSDVTGSGKSGFRANLMTILAEVRAKAAVVNPTAIAEIKVTAAP
jgi:hypothetical protein